MFDEAEKSLIRNCLGYADLYRYKNPRLEGVLSGNVLSAETENLVRQHLANFQVVEARILSRGIGIAGIKKADDIEFFQGKAYKELRSWGKMYVARVSIALGVPVYSDIFSTEGYLGDKYSDGALGSRYNSKLIPLG